MINMNFCTLYADIDQKALAGKAKPYDAISKITVCEYINSTLSYTKTWDIEKSSAKRSDLPYFHEAWREINSVLFNKTVIMFDANYTTATIVATYKYLTAKTVPGSSPDKKTELAFPGLMKEFTAIKFDYLCLSLLLRRLIKNLPSNKLDNLCSVTGIDFGTTTQQHAQAIGSLFLKLCHITDIADIMSLKHLAGITLGQLTYTSYLKTTGKEVADYNKCYVPCLPITEEQIFKKFEL